MIIKPVIVLIVADSPNTKLHGNQCNSSRDETHKYMDRALKHFAQ
jgi:hypothetical protein